MSNIDGINYKKKKIIGERKIEIIKLIIFLVCSLFIGYGSGFFFLYINILDIIVFWCL